MVIEELQDTSKMQVVELTAKGKILYGKIKFMPFIRYVSLIKSLHNGLRTFGDLQAFNQKHFGPHLLGLVNKGYVKINQEPDRNYRSTDVELVSILNLLNKNGRYDQVIKKAAKGDYHDMKSYSDWPKEMLINDLSHFYELDDLIERIRLGEFNEAPIRSKN